METDDNKEGAPGGASGNAAKKSLLIEALSYIGRYKGKIVVIKYGGAAQVQEAIKTSFAQDIVLLQSLGMLPVIVHGGGSEVSKTMSALGQKPSFVQGLRVTTKEGLDTTEMVLSGRINKDIVARLNAQGGRGVGLSGKDGLILRARKMELADGVDLGLVGEIVGVDVRLITLLLDSGYLPVISPIGMSEDGTTYNINADSAASRVAAALKAEKIVFMTDVNGVMQEGKRLSEITVETVQRLIAENVITGGMLPKIEAMIHCLENGVHSAQIINGEDHHSIIAELFTDKGIGTKITP